MITQRVGVLGAGWLGTALVQQLIRRGHTVHFSRARGKGSPIVGATGFQVIVEMDRITGDPAFWELDVLFVLLPFRRGLPDPVTYRHQIECLADRIEESPIQWVIMASSTSVYPEATEVATEDMLLMPDSPRSAALLEAENALLYHSGFNATVVRLAGLYGPGRPLGQRSIIRNPEQRVNLIQQDDAVGIMVAILEQHAVGDVFNAVSDTHPVREVLYKAAARAGGFSEPVFEPDPIGHPWGKVVSNHKVKEKLHYTFLHPDPMDGLTGLTSSGND
jgi:nucleoside-diphosphate-sugar epimerase